MTRSNNYATLSQLNIAKTGRAAVLPVLSLTPIKKVFMQKNSNHAEMKTMADCLNKLVLDGYTENFKASERGLLSLDNERIYEPGQIHVVNFYRFEGASDPADNSILYAIETSDGIKGTLVDAYGPYADARVDSFMKEVEDIHKKNASNDPTKN